MAIDGGNENINTKSESRTENAISDLSMKLSSERLQAADRYGSSEGSYILEKMQITGLDKDDRLLPVRDEKSSDVSPVTIEKFRKLVDLQYGSPKGEPLIGPETHSAFENLCKTLPNLSDPEFAKVFKEEIVRDRKVQHEVILRYLEDMLKGEGFTTKESKFGNDGVLTMVNKKTGTELNLAYKLNTTDREKSEATVKVTRTKQ